MSRGVGTRLQEGVHARRGGGGTDDVGQCCGIVVALCHPHDDHGGDALREDSGKRIGEGPALSEIGDFGDLRDVRGFIQRKTVGLGVGGRPHDSDDGGLDVAYRPRSGGNFLDLDAV